MKIERRQPTKAELASTTSSRPVLRRIPPPEKVHSPGPNEMDVARGPGIDNTRVRVSQDVATAESQRAKASEHQRQARVRREHAAQWYEYEILLAESHRKLSEEHEARALALREAVPMALPMDGVGE